MKIAIIDNNTITEIGEHTSLFPNVSFPVTGLTDTFIQEFSIKYVYDWKNYNAETEKLVNCEPYIEGDFVYTVLVVEKSLDDITEDNLLYESSIRYQRNQLLKDSDWTQTPDAPVDKQAWVEYRQQLRDITLQDGFPLNVVFPTAPG